MSLSSAARPSTFASLRVPAFRSFFIGQTLSLPGTWMQTVAQGWLVIQLTGSGAVLGAVIAAQLVPVLLLAPWGGVLADRYSKRWLLVGTQALMAATALAMGVVTVTGRATIPFIVLTALVFGVATAVDNPTRQSFVSDIVPTELVRNAVSLNAALLNSARATGPAIAGILIVATGPGWCFLLNAASFTGVLVALTRMRVPQFDGVRPQGGAWTELAQGLRHVVSRRDLLWPCATVFVVASLAWEFPITLPLLARETFDSDARLYGWLTSAMGVGAVFGSLLVARQGRTSIRAINERVIAFGVALALLSIAPTPALAILALIPVGTTGSAFISTCNATIQLASDDHLRGRVMSIWSLCFIGSTPVGGPIVGLVAELFSPRWAVGVGSGACLLAAVALTLTFMKPRPT